MTLIVACGLKREARLFERPGVHVVAGGGDSVRLARDLHELAAQYSGIILSCGIAGALDPSLRTGDVVIDGDRDVIDRLHTALSQARVGAVVGGDAIVATAVEKRALAARTGAIAVDMETHVARAVAEQRGSPFGALRVISDCADEDLPPATLVGMRPDGGMALGPVLWSLVRQPGQLPALVRAGRQVGRAFRSLSDAFAAVGGIG